MNLSQLITRLQELYVDPITTNNFITPSFIVDSLNDIILRDYWTVWQDKEYSYFKSSQNLLNIYPGQNIYPLPNGDPAQTDLLNFSTSTFPNGTSFSLKIVQGANTYTTAPITSLSAAAIQSAILTATGGTPSCTVTAITGTIFLILWDLTSSSPITLTVNANNTGATIQDTTTPYNVNALNVGFVTQIVPMNGPVQNPFGRPLESFDPNAKYEQQLLGGFIPAPGWQPWAPGSNLRWCFDSGNPDGNGYPTYTIRFVPMPNQALTLAYDILRYPRPLSNVTPINTNQIPDLPTHFGPNLVYRLLKECFVRAGIDVTETDKIIMDLDEKANAVQSQGIQRQRTDTIRRVR